MANTKSAWGNRLEVVGLAMVFMATVAEVRFTDYWDDQFRDWQAYIQEDINFTEIKTLQDLAQMLILSDNLARKAIADEISSRVNGAMTRAIENRNERQAAKEHGKAAWFLDIKSLLLVCGSAFLAFGKFLTHLATEKDS
jgi:hypothetical protein